MAEVFKTPLAETDLLNIWLYIARDNPAAADRVYDAIEKTFDLLVSMPEIGTVYSSKQAKLQGLRSFPVKSYVK